MDKILAAYHDQVHPEGEPAVFLLDEVQYSREWDLHLKFLIDHRPETRIVATGSAALRQRRDSIDSGVGRWITVPMPPLSFYEFLRIRDRALPDVPRDLRPQDLFQSKKPYLAHLAESFRGILPEFQRYLLVGGFPETALSRRDGLLPAHPPGGRGGAGAQAGHGGLFGVRKINELEKLFIYLCLNTGGVLSVKTCASELGTTAATIDGYPGAAGELPPGLSGSPLRR